MNSTEWAKSHTPEVMLNFIRVEASRRKLRLFTTACCRRSWTVLTDARSRAALDTIESYVDSEASDLELKESSDAAELAFRSQRLRVLTSMVGSDIAKQAIQTPSGLFGLIDINAARAAYDAADSDPACMAASAAWSATGSDLELQDAGYELVDTAINRANEAAVFASDTTSEEAIQAELLRDIFGDPFRELALDSQWATQTVIAIAKEMYSSRDFGAIRTLADALEAAGCGDVDILEHCRSRGPHVRGCWVVDLILGKR